MSAVSDLVNGWPGGIIQAGRHGVFVTPIYLVNQLYATHLGARSAGGDRRRPHRHQHSGGTDVPVLDAVATRSADGRTISIKAVNTDLERPLRARISLRGARVAASATLERVVAGSLVAANGFRTPNAVRATRESVSVRKRFRAQSAPALGIGAHAHSRALAAIAGLSQPFCYHRACLRRDG